MVQDLGEVNIGIFKDNDIRIIDAQPSEKPLTAEWVESNIARYKSMQMGS